MSCLPFCNNPVIEYLSMQSLFWVLSISFSFLFYFLFFIFSLINFIMFFIFSFIFLLLCYFFIVIFLKSFFINYKYNYDTSILSFLKKKFIFKLKFFYNIYYPSIEIAAPDNSNKIRLKPITINLSRKQISFKVFELQWLIWIYIYYL